MSEQGLQRKLEFSMLNAFYGPLLTDRQRATIVLYCDEDLSLAEVAAQQRVSRQSVNDTLRRAYGRMLELEHSMGLMERFSQMQAILAKTRQTMGDVVAGRQGVHALEPCIQAVDEYLTQEEAGNGL